MTVQKQNTEASAETAQRDRENCKAMQMEGKPLLANGQKAIFRMHGKEATSIFNLVDQAFIVLQSELTTQIHINRKTYSEGQVRIKQLRTWVQRVSQKKIIPVPPSVLPGELA